MIAELLIGIQICLVLYFSYFAFYNYVYAFASLKKSKFKTVQPSGKKVAVVIVSYNEQTVIEDTVKACEQLSYENKTVIVADDSQDGVTFEILRRMAIERGCKEAQNIKHDAHEGPIILEAPGFTVFHRKHNVGFKAGSLKELEKYLKANGYSYMYLLDSEWWPQQDMLERCLEVLEADEQLAYVQTKRNNSHSNMNFLEHCLALCDNGCYYVDMQGRQVMNDPVLFTGCCTMFRLSALYDVQGFLPGHLTEDIDLTNRYYLRGWKAKYIDYLQSDGEAPPTYNAFRRQQDRWTAGTARALKEHFWPIIKSKRLSLKEKMSLFRQNAYFTSAIAIEVSILLSFLSVLLFIAHSDNYQAMLYQYYMAKITIPYSIFLLWALSSSFLPLIITTLKRKSYEDFLFIPYATWIAWSALHTYFMANIKGFFNTKQDWFHTPKTNRQKYHVNHIQKHKLKLLNLVTLALLIAVYSIEWYGLGRLDVYAFFWVPALVKGVLLS